MMQCWRRVVTPSVFLQCGKYFTSSELLLKRTLSTIPYHTGYSSVNLVRRFHTNPVISGKVIPFNLSDIGEGIAEVQVLEWYVKEGDVVKQFDKICEVQSDKAAVEITSRYDGVVRKIHYEVDDIAKVGNPLVDIELEDDDSAIVIGSSGKDTSSDAAQSKVGVAPAPVASPAAMATGNKVQATPAVRRIANEHNINISEVTGTGKDGRVLKEDVLRHLEMLKAPAPSATPSPAATPTDTSPITMPKVAILTEDRTITIKGYKRTMVKTMTQSGEIPQFGYCDEINMDALVRLRQRVKEDFEQQGMKFTYMPLLIKALSHALSSFPMLNAVAAADASSITYKASRNIGIAIDTQDGLVVPNIKSVQAKSVLEVSDDMNRLTDLAHRGKLGPLDLTGGTFSISNIGAIGGTYARPMLLPPEVAIGAFGKIHVLPRFTDDGDVRPAHVMHVSWSADHRLVDGATVARFSNLWRSFVENPAKLALELK
ncbi:lipoamide acyltransferase component of branched-chain alpha-keto acid dehydrogenase complex, mitochondrial-like [Dysidea avara]|uniref:lipoamide acyltransferase component of branched-chain alpha-keto acid dehydrogenase complex, mitochondrial-like n=1 Tax=Dysidea avara TaxID=196820 RepID=UPI0033326CF9